MAKIITEIQNDIKNLEEYRNSILFADDIFHIKRDKRYDYVEKTDRGYKFIDLKVSTTPWLYIKEKACSERNKNQIDLTKINLFMKYHSGLDAVSSLWDAARF